MFSYRMARKPFSYASLWLITLLFPTIVFAFNLSTEFSDFVPSCAEECFQSFLRVNYGTDKCGTSPSLQCLCARLGASGDTLAEGAVQCIAAERSIGFCSPVEASDAVIQNAFYMCDGKVGAIQPTRGTITATLVLPPSGGRGIVTFPPLTTTTTTSRTSATSLPTTLVIDTSEPPPLPTSRSHSPSTSSSSSRSTSSTSSSPSTSILSSDTQVTARPTTFTTLSKTSTSSAETSTSTEVPAAAGGSGDSNSLNSGQVAGISIGVLAAAGFAIGAILLARYYRRRNHPNIKTGFFPMRDTWGYKPEQGRKSRGTSWIAQQINGPLDQFTPPPPPSYSRASYKPEAIGLAISPPQSRAQSRVMTQTSSPMRRISKLLPAKPTLPILPLSIHNRQSRSAGEDDFETPLQPNAAASNRKASRESRRESRRASSRQNVPQPPPAMVASPISVASPARSKPIPPAPPKLHIPGIPSSGNLMGSSSNQNGRESTMTEFEEDGTQSAGPGTQVWRPPPTTPHSATTYYVADQFGNWVLGGTKRASLIVPTWPTDGPDVLAKGKNPTSEVSKAQNVAASSQQPPAEQPKAFLAPPAEIKRNVSQSSSVYSQPSVRNAPHTYPLFSSHPNPPPRRSSSLQRSMSRNLTRPREPSTDSGITIINTSSEDEISDPSPPLEEPYGTLSPVVESPLSKIKNSPATYPKIPGRDPRRLSRANAPAAATVRAVPPPSRAVYYPPGQPSPTLGMDQPAPGPGMTSINVPNKGRRPMENPGLEKTGSPTMRMVEPSPEPEPVAETPLPPMDARAPAFFFDPPYPQPLNTQRQPQQPYASFNPQARQQPQQHPHRHSQQQQQPQQHPQQRPQQHLQQHPQQYPYAGFNPQYRPQPQQHPQGGFNPNVRPQPQQARPYPNQPSYGGFNPQPRPQTQQQPYGHFNPSHQPQSHHFQSQRHGPRPEPPPQYRPTQPPLAPPQRPNLDYASPISETSNSSSLLAKRLGSDRAADMSIPTDPSKASKWRRDGQEAGTPTQDEPISPPWLPRLTPTRRGDDLFLNVQ